jgi:hypothetical protein
MYKKRALEDKKKEVVEVSIIFTSNALYNLLSLLNGY